MPYSCLLALFLSTMSRRSLFLNNKCLVKESKGIYKAVIQRRILVMLESKKAEDTIM